MQRQEMPAWGISVSVGLVFPKLFRNFVFGGIKHINSKTHMKYPKSSFCVETGIQIFFVLLLCFLVPNLVPLHKT